MAITSQISTGDAKVTVSNKIASKLTTVRLNIEREMEEISHMNTWAPHGYEGSNQFIKAAKMVRQTDQSMRMSLLSKLDSFREGKGGWVRMYGIVTNFVVKKVKNKRGESEKKTISDITEDIDDHKSQYFKWRSKRDYKLAQEKKFNQFLEIMDTNPLFLYSRLLEDAESQLITALRYLRQISIDMKIKLSNITVDLIDDAENVSIEINAGGCNHGV